MARGNPDYDNQNNAVAVQSTDNGELIPIMTGGARVDGRGRVVFYDDFRLGLYQWRIHNANGGALPVHVLIAGRVFGFAGSILFDPQVVSGESYMNTTVFFPVSDSYGLELAMYRETDAGLVEFGFDVKGSSDQSYRAIVGVENGTGKIYIYDGVTLTYVYVPTSQSAINGGWLFIKFVVDTLTGKWVRALVGGVELDLSAYNLRAQNGGQLGFVSLIYNTQGYAAASFEPIYLSHVILTVDEP